MGSVLLLPNAMVIPEVYEVQYLLPNDRHVHIEEGNAIGLVVLEKQPLLV